MDELEQSGGTEDGKLMIFFRCQWQKMAEVEKKVDGFYAYLFLFLVNCLTQV